MVGEVDDNNADYVCSFQNYIPGVLNYGTYFPLINAFRSTSGDMTALVNIVNQVKSSCQDSTLLGSFSENHDQPRFASLNEDMAAASNILAFTILADGIPILYQGQEQHYAAYGNQGSGSDPYNREALWFSNYNTQSALYLLISQLNAARKNAIRDDGSYLSYKNWPIYHDTTTIAMRKGKMVTVLSNKGSSGATYTQQIPAGYGANTQVTELLTCSTLTADGNGNINVPMGGGAPRVYYPSSGLGSLCGAASRKNKVKPRLTKSAERYYRR
jgi:alpha-amylase